MNFIYNLAQYYDKQLFVFTASKKQADKNTKLFRKQIKAVWFLFGLIAYMQSLIRFNDLFEIHNQPEI
jgi:hypothetical protein